MPGCRSESGDTPSVAKQRENKQGDIDRASLERSAQRIRDELSKLPEADKLKGQIDIQATPDGMRIELIDSKEGTFFDSGADALDPRNRRVSILVVAHVSESAEPHAAAASTSPDAADGKSDAASPDKPHAASGPKPLH